jgi:predicted nicotinamide N-methyase
VKRTTKRPTPPASLWLTIDIAGCRFQTLNLDHPQIDACIMGEITSGIDVYYDRRWDVTERFCRFLLAEPAWVDGRTVLVLGAGVGLETLVIGYLCKKLYINDLAPVALELCARQLCQNGISDVTCLPGRYETLALPAVDLIAGCFLVYNRETAAAMRQFLARRTPPVLLMNDNVVRFHKFVRETSRPMRALLPPEDVPCILFAT